MASSPAWTLAVTRFLFAILALFQLANAWPYAFYSQLETCPAVPIPKGLPPPSVGPMKGWFQVIGQGKWYCDQGKPRFFEMRKAKVYEIGSLYFDEPAKFKALATEKVFAMEYPDRAHLDDTSKLYPSRLFAFLNSSPGVLENEWDEDLWTDAAVVKADLGDSAQAKAPSKDQAFRPGSVPQGDKIASATGSNPLSSEGKGPNDAQLTATLPGQERGLPDMDIFARRSRQLPNPPLNPPLEQQISNPGTAPNSRGKTPPGARQDPPGSAMIASSQGPTGFTKLRKRSPQSQGPSKQQIEKYLRMEDPFSNEFWPSPLGDPNWEAKQWELKQEKGDKSSYIPSQGHGIWSGSSSKAVPNGKNLPMAHYISNDRTVEAYRINTVKGLPNDCNNIGRKDGRMLYWTAYQLVFFRKGCSPGLSGHSQSPPLFCAPSHGECPRDVAQLQAQHRRYLAQQAAKKKPKPVNPYAPQK